MYIRPLAISGELRKVPKVHILPSWLCRCPEAGHQQQIVCSLTPCRFATTAIGSRSARRRIARTCSSVNFDLRMLPSDSEGSLSTNRMARKLWGRSRCSEAFKKSSSSPNAGSAASKASSRRRTPPHTKSDKCDWLKVKCAQWKEENKDRGDLFESR
jgi:hypothetical protein